MAEPPTSESVRKRPGMYVGSTGDGSGLIHMVLELIANAFDQHLAGRCRNIDLAIAADGTITVEDDGPGFAAAGRDGVPAIATLLATRSTRPTVDGHKPHVHLGIGSLGLFVINALSERFELVSVADGQEARTIYARGHVLEPVAVTPTTRPSGTRIRFRPDPEIFAHGRVPRAELTQVLEDLTFLAPGLRFRWTIEGDDIAGLGLRARVALEVPCAIEEVAHARASYKTAKGPLEVEVALTWSSHIYARREPRVHSFVNLGRTPGDGMHVEGMLDGIRAFVGGGSRDATKQGLVAAVSVVLEDVLYGSPTKDRLASPEVIEPVSEATRKALAAWAVGHPEAAAALKTRGTERWR